MLQVADIFYIYGSSLWFPGAVSLVVALIIVLTKQYHIHWSARGHAGLAVQSVHDLPTPRIGGVAVLFGLIAALAFLRPDTAILLALVLVSSLPVFMAGLFEDVGLGASPRARLLMAGVSSAIMILFTGATIQSGGIAWLDWILSFGPLAVVFTVFATAGVAHAFNIVDGLNGLSKAITMSVTIAYGAIAFSIGDNQLAELSVSVVIVVLGVFFVNFPFGKVFLGDAGAYVLGHITAWIAVLLMARHPEISPWAVLLAAFWPVMETVVAIWRRWHRALPADEADRMHFHHIVMRLLMVRMRGNGNETKRARANPLATALIAPLFIVPPVLAVYLATENLQAQIAFVVCAIVYVVVRQVLFSGFRVLAKPPMRAERRPRSKP
jgi:UDP-GlcNAc:undecaprenyl-phosphate GlcNAc-1-phosphate transferase